MKRLWKIAIIILANGLGLWLCARYIPGFTLSNNWKHILLVGAILTILNATVKPILKLILGPVIILTLGLGLILVNVVVLYILDILSQHLTIENAFALVAATLILSATNIFSHTLTK